MKVVMKLPSRLTRIGATLALTAIFVGPAISYANNTTAHMPAGSNASQMHQLEQRYMQIRETLAKTERKAVANDPALIKKRKDFQNKLIDVMQHNGEDVKKDIADLTQIGKEFRKKGLSTEKKHALEQKARKIQYAVFKAERKAMKNPDLIKMQKDLQASTLTAMRKIDPKTDQLLNELKQIEMKLAKVHESQMKGAGK